MNLSSRYLFARTISAGSVPPVEEIIFFENGVFNSRHIPTGFDFENNVLRIASEREETLTPDKFQKAALWDFEHGVHSDHLDDGTTFFVNSYAANNEESFTLDYNTGYLVFDHPRNRIAVNRYNAFAQLNCKVPISNLRNTFDYICMRCRYVASANIENSSQVGITIYKKEGGSIYSGKSEYVDIKDDLYGQGWVDVTIDNSDYQEEFDFLSLYFNAMLESYDIEVGDIPFKIEVSRIWFTNTRPE